jgi:DNA-binding XRE family transcriptional regulator
LPDQRFSPSRFKGLRERAGVSRIEVAYVAHRTEQTVWLWERGKVTPQVEILARVASHLGCAVGDFFDDDGARV